MDNKKKQDSRDDSKVDSTDKSEVEYVHSQRPHLTHAQVQAGIKAAGPVRKDILEYLDKTYAK